MSTKIIDMDIRPDFFNGKDLPVWAKNVGLSTETINQSLRGINSGKRRSGLFKALNKADGISFTQYSRGQRQHNAAVRKIIRERIDYAVVLRQVPGIGSKALYELPHIKLGKAWFDPNSDELMTLKLKAFTKKMDMITDDIVADKALEIKPEGILVEPTIEDDVVISKLEFAVNTWWFRVILFVLLMIDILIMVATR